MKNYVELERQDDFARAAEAKTFDYMAEFAAGAGHELNNPLAVISVVAQTLLREETSSDKRRALATIIDQTRVGYEMLASLRSFARPPVPSLRKMNAREFFEERFARERALLAESAIETRADNTLPNDLTFDSDPEFLATIIHSLTRNASESVQERERGKILLTVELSRGGILVGVEDNGDGMTEEARALAYAPYFSGRRAGRGLGVGLPLARRFAERLGAELFDENARAFESGTRWSVFVPIGTSDRIER